VSSKAERELRWGEEGLREKSTPNEVRKHLVYRGRRIRESGVCSYEEVAKRLLPVAIELGVSQQDAAKALAFGWKEGAPDSSRPELEPDSIPPQKKTVGRVVSKPVSDLKAEVCAVLRDPMVKNLIRGIVVDAVGMALLVAREKKP
jgi:hypothetical protein